MNNKNILSIIIVLLVLTSFALVETNYITFKDLKGIKNGLSAAGSCSNNKYIYLTGGFNKFNFYNNEIHRYNIEEDDWEKIGKSKIEHNWGNCEIIDNSLYIFNGATSSGLANEKMEVIDLSTMKATEYVKNPTPASAAGSAVFDRKIYVFGGCLNKGSKQKTYSNRLYRFDPDKNEWKRLANMPEGKETQGVFINGRLYTIGGYLGYGRKSYRIDVYDPEIDTWTNYDRLKEPISGCDLAVNSNDIFIVGDYNYLSTLAKYNIRNKVFTNYESNIIGARHPASIVTNGKLYVIGGNKISKISSSLNRTQYIELEKFID